ncbi:hypothetical protein ASD45_13005 [Pseudolabrys sp. Root1462]|jgi:Domain of unknown function (DUF2019)|uniref:DUF2019 domain-containing protein n=1 Tax=Pseudolabrys sp. Root1462 TaxID=1736466 RepID=UPI00070352E8|nr:DUF2019 domain-containing protein [Pseudolabrys sp. Root1462]KQZ01670.1 hypothetical protein ASD45_13005 [Pseudolabrys sp. Root1462]
MTRTKLASMSVPQLVELFTAIGLNQYTARMGDDIAKYNRLFDEMTLVVGELQRRAGDQRSALIKLYDHPNIQVRLAAAKKTLALAPSQARQLIEAVAGSGQPVYAGDAGMCLWALDQGIFKPA